jgi:hypothetical protein
LQGNWIHGRGIGIRRYRFIDLVIIAMLGMEPMASQTLGRCSITKLHPSSRRYSFFFLFFFFCSTGAWTQGLHLEPLHQPFLWWIFSRQGLENYLPRLAVNLDPLDLCLLSSQDYGCKPLMPG